MPPTLPVHVLGLIRGMAITWHAHSDHRADGIPYGDPLCDCERIARRAVALGWRERTR